MYMAGKKAEMNLTAWAIMKGMADPLPSSSSMQEADIMLK